ncbi:enoyl-CoA hydratase/isomerase family protein [Chloroflexota bacterium]
MEYKNIILEKAAGIVKLTINRPPVNVINYETLMEINHALEELAKDAEAKVVIIRGNGNRAFCAGIEVKDHIGEMMPKMMREFERLFKLLRDIDKPTIAVVNGVALGGGCELVAGCDFAIASEKAELGQPEIVLGGLAPAAAAIFPRIMGEKRAFELILLGDNVKAKDAERFGLVNRVVPEADLDMVAEEIAKKFLSKSSLSVRLVRQALYRCADLGEYNTALQKATELGIKSWETEDGQEGLKSFLEKRAPTWKNK